MYLQPFLRNNPQKLLNSAKWRKLHGHYAVQGHSRSPILVPIESPYATFYQWLIQTYLLSCTVSKLWLIMCQIFASDSRSLHFNAPAGGEPLQISP